MTDLKLWELQVRERGPNHRNYVCDPLPSRSSASHGSERVLESSLDGLARHGIREFETDCRIRAINRTDFGPLRARPRGRPALPQLIVVLHRGIEIKGEMNRAIQ